MHPLTAQADGLLFYVGKGHGQIDSPGDRDILDMMTDDDLKIRFPGMSEKTRRSYLRVVEIRKDIVALKSLMAKIESNSFDRLLAKLGYNQVDQHRARRKKDELVRIIRDRLRMQRAKN